MVFPMRGIHVQAPAGAQEGVQGVPPHARRRQRAEAAPQRPAADDGGIPDRGDEEAGRRSSQR